MNIECRSKAFYLFYKKMIERSKTSLRHSILVRLRWVRYFAVLSGHLFVENKPKLSGILRYNPISVFKEGLRLAAQHLEPEPLSQGCWAARRSPSLKNLAAFYCTLYRTVYNG